MVNLFDIARQSAHGGGFERLGREFGLDQNAVQRAVEALLPAFSHAFQKLAFDPNAFAWLAAAVGSGLYRPAFDNPQRSAAIDGSAVVTHFFGSDERARRIAEHAASFAGVTVEVMQRMLPVVAAALIGGMSRYATMEGFADLLRQWSDALRTEAARNQPPSQKVAGGGPWAAWSDMVAAATQTRPPSPPPAPAPAPAPNPYEAWLQVMQSFWTPTAPASPPPPPPPTPAQPNPVQALATMFDTGRDIQAQYVASVARIVDEFWRPGPAR